jgi:eukaryotic-like serine/threonine-protein kinase
MTEARQREWLLFEELVELSGEAARRAFLERHCQADPAMRRRLEELLALQGPAETLLSPLPTASADEFESYSGDRRGRSVARIGRYKILRKLGTGGCGVVYLAEQEEPVRRQVALKVIRLGMDTESVITRFERERQALAIMDHPNIARVLDAGTTDSGRPYFVMELVHGIRITDYCAQHFLTIEERLRLFMRVCHALQHAHQKGIIHRDIKPSNILVTTQDGQPMPKIIDFGIAKAVESRQAEPGLTVQLLLIGTPAYMSPEQADLGNPDLDTRSDIYSLGVLLHELLTGRTPFDSKELESGGLERMRRIICEREIPRPSAVLASLPPEELRVVASQRRAEPARLLAAVRGDLDWIVAAALEKDRRRRYETANGLSMDIRRYLAHELVAARPPSRLYRLEKLYRRNRAAFFAGALVLLTLLAGLGLSTWLLHRERIARREQERLLQQAEVGEKVAQAAVRVLNYKKFEEADALVAGIDASLFRPSLECAKVLGELGEWHAIAGRWRESADRHFALALVLTQVDPSDSDKVSFSLLPAASAICENGDNAQYDAFRRNAVARFARTSNPMPAEQVLKASLLTPADPDLLAGLAPLAEVVAATFEGADHQASADPYLDAWRSFALGLLAQRRGDLKEAIRWSRRCLTYRTPNPPREVSARMVLAMAYAQLGRQDEAAQLVADAQAIVEERFKTPLLPWEPAQQILWFDWINARLLLREAAALLDPRDKPSPTNLVAPSR